MSYIEIPVKDFRSNTKSAFDMADQGESVIITRGKGKGKRHYKLISVEHSLDRVMKVIAETEVISEEEFERDLQEISDHMAAQE